MRTETFTEEHPVALTEDDRAVRSRQSTRQAVAIRAQKTRAERETEAWAARKKELKTEEEAMVADLYRTSEAAESGVEKRQVLCREELVGMMVVTVRLDTLETVGSRAASKDELRPPEKARTPNAPAAPEDIDGKLRRVLTEVCGRERPEALVLKALEKGCPESTAEGRKAFLASAIEDGRLVEHDGKFLLVQPPQGAPPGQGSGAASMN